MFNFLLLLLSCSSSQTPIKIEVPTEYVGWCYIIPVNDTADFIFRRTHGKYQSDSSGVVYIPSLLFNVKLNNIIEVYDNGIDISNAMRYAGSVYKVDADKKKYNYASFYLPSTTERSIDDAEEYWRDKRDFYSHPNIKKFDSLVKYGAIVFR